MTQNACRHHGAELQWIQRPSDTLNLKSLFIFYLDSARMYFTQTSQIGGVPSTVNFGFSLGNASHCPSR